MPRSPSPAMAQRHLYCDPPTATCTGNGNFGTVSSGANYVGPTVTFTGSTISWNPTTDALTFKLGVRVGSGTGRPASRCKPRVHGRTQMTDTSGIPTSTTTFMSGTTSGF